MLEYRWSDKVVIIPCQNLTLTPVSCRFLFCFHPAILTQPENNARTQDRGLNGSAETAGSAKQARAGDRVSRQGAPSADKLAGGGTCNNNADGIGGVGAGADAGASVDASADIVDDDGPPTTIDEDLALVSFFSELS